MCNLSVSVISDAWTTSSSSVEIQNQETLCQVAQRLSNQVLFCFCFNSSARYNSEYHSENTVWQHNTALKKTVQLFGRTHWFKWWNILGKGLFYCFTKSTNLNFTVKLHYTVQRYLCLCWLRLYFRSLFLSFSNLKDWHQISSVIMSLYLLLW